MNLIPAAFNMSTGPLHWELLFRARAVDAECFVIGTSPARDIEASYHAYGHSLAVDPWGHVMRQLDEKEGMLGEDINLAEVKKVREQIPSLSASL
ncbi:MAG: nitrilase-related carbon-nitrogen hydrolase [Eubacterium sp.]|nr:nitrilase-related carbon-nitrogen hydrolase [Eubacterium sp.]